MLLEPKYDGTKRTGVANFFKYLQVPIILLANETGYLLPINHL